MLTAEVPAGLTVLQALDQVADIETRYGGRFVQAIEGIEGSLAGRRDWFYFLNGIEPDVGAAEVRLRAGDVAWWDFRSWSGEMQQPVVVGAFPEPFRHGWDGRTRPLEVVAPPELAGEAAALEASLAATGTGSPNRFELVVEDGAEGAELSGTRGAETGAPVTFTLQGSLEAVRAAAREARRRSGDRALPLCSALRRNRGGGRMRLGPVPAALLLAAAAAAALLAEHFASVAVIAAALLVALVVTGGSRRHVYLYGALVSGLGVLLVWPFVAVVGTDVLWSGPTVPVLGPLDVTSEEIWLGALAALRLTAVALAFSVYAVALDHDRLLASVGFARRSALAAALATRLIPTLERDAAGLADAVRGRGLEVRGVRGRAALVSPLVAGSLERALNLAEAMEARGFGRPGRTRAPHAPWGRWDIAAAGLAILLVVAGALWL